MVKLTKALYGLVQSALLWYRTITDFLLRNGFVINDYDQCVLNKTVDGVQATICLYVDDMLCTCVSEEVLENIKRMLIDEYHEIQEKSGLEISYLGMLLRVYDGRIEMSMENYIREVLKAYGGDLKVFRTPAASTLYEGGDGSVAAERPRLFHEIVAKLLFLCKRARPDISVAVLYLCTRVKSPTRYDVEALERVLGYLKGSIRRIRVFDDSPFVRVEAYIDAAFSCHKDGKGRNGMVLTLGNTPVCTGSRKQVLTAKNSTVAEIVAASDEVSQIELIEGFLSGQGYKLKPAILYQDNTSAITLMVKGGGKQTNKHVRARIGNMNDMVRRNEIEVQYIPTGEMIADCLTKPLQGSKFAYFTRRILGLDTSSSNHQATGVRWKHAHAAPTLT